MGILIALQQFLGANTQRNNKTPLPPGVGVDAVNLDVSHGDFRGLKAADVVHTLTGLGSQQISAYRFGRDTAPADNGTDIWLTSSSDVDYMRSMIALDTTERTYYTDGVKPRYTDSTLIGGSPPYPAGSVTLGVPAPTAAMTATETTPGTGPDETRVYLDTFMRANGDESAPNALTESITVKSGATVLLNGFAAVPGGSHGITKRRIYVSTGGVFLRIAEITTGTASHSDNGSVRGLTLQTGGATNAPTWIEPPDTLKGLTSLWNGMAGGFVGKSYRLCVPNYPHAWPIEYEGVVPDTIVGTAVFGTNWFLATTGQPRVVNGTSPGNMKDMPTDFDQACVSKRSVVSVKHGACWASNEGLCYYGAKGARILTEGFIDVDTWRALVPSSIIGAFWKGWYIGFYYTGSVRKGFMVSVVDPQWVIWLDQGAFGVFTDTVSGNLYLLDSAFRIRKWYSGAVQSATFKTGKVRANHETNPGAALVEGTTYTSASLKMYADGVLKHTQTLTGRTPFRLPSGYVARDFQLELTGTGPIEGVVLAEEVMDLP
ncbi:MAG: hypothetical protein K0Q92_2987 [Steroidobacteraceae bacterium]|jgi:hypothetical protein|nr:hypothetical protein [Thermomicrobiales bacterium]MDF3021684.1 hypothetical protein [Steroidobacteraceae bacterium]